jgi:hypothetical protein
MKRRLFFSLVVLAGSRAMPSDISSIKKEFMDAANSESSQKRFEAAMVFPELWRLLSIQDSQKISKKLLDDTDKDVLSQMLLAIKGLAPTADEVKNFLLIVQPLENKLTELEAKGATSGIRSLASQCIEMLRTVEKMRGKDHQGRGSGLLPKS